MRLRIVLLGIVLVLTLCGARPATAQSAAARAEALADRHAVLYDLVVRLEQAHGLVLGAIASEGEAMRASGAAEPTPGFEADLLRRLNRIVQGSAAERAVAAATAGYSVLGARGAEVVRRANAFQREVLSILADPSVTDPRAELAEAVVRYRSRPEVALPDVPKDMDILYGHPYALALRTSYPELDGFAWAGHWLRLAATEPLTDLPAGPDRLAGIDTVTTRYFAKLSNGEPPAAYPTELPLAPAISPGLIWLSPESAMIWDNLSMLLEVVGDVLASPETTDVAASLDAAIDFFLDPYNAVTDQDEWEIMALRHGIFFQGGFPLAVMTQNERNTGGHSAHGGARVLMAIPGMPIRR